MTPRARRSTRLSLWTATALFLACSNDNSGDITGSGGHAAGTGGATASGGSTAAGTGGATVGTGGAGTGGATKGTGGAGTGGTTVSTGSGGASGLGGKDSGGASGQGGAQAGGRSGSGGTGPGAGGSTGLGGARRDGGLGGQSGSSGSGGQTGIDGGGTTGTACASPLPAVTDYTPLAGPFATTTENNTGPDGKCVIYRPKTLGENGFMHAPIVFGPGISMQASQLSGLLLSFASHGYIVIGTGVLTGGPNDPGNKSQMQNALDWIIKQNSQAGAYQGKIATKCAISMGYSVGGTAAVEIGGDPAVATVVSIHGHTATAALHGTMLQTTGTADTQGIKMQQKTYDQSKVQTFMGTVTNADHGYIQNSNGGVQRPAIIAWMRYWINGDTGAKSYFWGNDCVLCKQPWENPQRKNWQ
jgi:hypothetical protein